MRNAYIGMRMKKIGGVLSALLIIAALIMNCMFGAEKKVEVSILFMAAFLLLLVLEVLTVTLSCLLSLGIMPIIGITPDFNSALVGFSNQVVFFILASFGLALAFSKVPVSKRLLRAMITTFGKNGKLVVLSFMVCTAILSSVISNLPTCALFLSVALDLLEFYPEAEKKQMGKTLMIGIPVASMIGGGITPAGSSINLLAISLLEKYTGNTITFVQWMSIGLPFVCILLPLSWAILVHVFAPAEVEQADLIDFMNHMDLPEHFTKEEKRVLTVSGIMLALWLLSSWIPVINVMVVTVIGCCIFCMPHLGVLTTKEFIEKVSWDAFFLVGTILSVASALVKNGVSDLLMKYLPGMSGIPVLLVLMYIILITFVLLIIIPGGHTIVTFLAPVVIEIAISAGINPVLAICVFGICACNCYLLPLDAVCLLTYGKGYYKMTEMAKATLPIQMCIVVVLSLIGAMAGYWFGWIS